ncbi:MAG: response regulator transcription factor [Anaerolineae bacterium]|nr:response regulator transcription factor [Anaerolineae bacterium]MCB9108654.1 response regulator transcription factor [Anaerolineales bacterium]
MNKIRVLLAEDHTIVRKGIRVLLDTEDDIEVVGEAEDGQEAIDQVEQFIPDLVLMDHTMPVLNGLEATRQIKKRFPDVKVLILTMYTTEEYILPFLQAGASGYLIKKTAPKELVTAIHAVYRGDSYLSPSISKTVIEGYIQQSQKIETDDNYEKLTDRERQILQMITEGFSNREIAERLHISIKTVNNHRVNLMDKLDIHSTAKLVKYAIRKGVISLDE